MLSIRGLKKRYGGFTALENLNLEVKKGELYGFVGANGAGKTTTMRIICGLLCADCGEVYVDGIPALYRPREIKKLIGYMPDFFGVYDQLKAIEYMEFYASIYGFRGKEATRLCMELMELVNLEHKSDTYVDSLSRGMKQRLCLARCLVHNPRFLILDEPAAGLDPQARHDMKEILKNLCGMGKTILLSSHILTELSEMCSTIGIIKGGQMVLSGSVEGILQKFSVSNPLVITVVDRGEEAARILMEYPGTSSVSCQGRVIRLMFAADASGEAALLRGLIEKGIQVHGFIREAGNLESLFIELTKEA
jgi:ABC-2 type transport system ATP-binding protein